MRLLKLIVLLLLFPIFLVSAFFICLGISLLIKAAPVKKPQQTDEELHRPAKSPPKRKNYREGAKDDLGTGGHFIVSNHFGYLDGVVLGSFLPVIFVAKREVKQWPVIGQLLTLLGTIFVDREDKKDIVRVVEIISETLRQETNVLLFPEGTSTNGDKLLPFRSAFFAAPLIARAIVVPITLTYRLVDQQPVSAANRDRIYWYGNMSFAPHLWDLLGAHRVEVSIKIHPRMATSELQNNSQGRKQLSQACYDLIAPGVSSETAKSLEALQLFPGILGRQPF